MEDRTYGLRDMAYLTHMAHATTQHALCTACLITQQHPPMHVQVHGQNSCCGSMCTDANCRNFTFACLCQCSACPTRRFGKTELQMPVLSIGEQRCMTQNWGTYPTHALQARCGFNRLWDLEISTTHLPTLCLELILLCSRPTRHKHYAKLLMSSQP